MIIGDRAYFATEFEETATIPRGLGKFRAVFLGDKAYIANEVQFPINIVDVPFRNLIVLEDETDPTFGAQATANNPDESDRDLISFDD